MLSVVRLALNRSCLSMTFIVLINNCCSYDPVEHRHLQIDAHTFPLPGEDQVEPEI